MSVLVAYRVRWWREILSLCLAAWALLIPIGYASATTTTSTFQSQVTIVASCTILNAANLDFGSNGILTANVDQTNSIQVQCTSSTPFDIGFDAGTASDERGQHRQVFALQRQRPYDELRQHRRYGYRLVNRNRRVTDIYCLRQSAGAGHAHTNNLHRHDHCYRNVLTRLKLSGPTQYWRAAAAIAATLLVFLPASLRAASLEVSPISLTIPAPGAATTIHLRNVGDSPLNAQIRVFRWIQVNGEDKLEPTEDVIASPPATRLSGRSDQIVRARLPLA